jgi:sugar lactone lactonase YvrE
MPEHHDPSGSTSEGGSAKSSGFGNIFSGGKDRAGDAEKSADKITEDTPGAGDGDWDDDEESVSGDISAFVHKLESGRDPWQPRQTAHGALGIMRGFLGPHFKNFQTAADGQRHVSEDPKSTSGMASSAAKSSAGEESFRDSAKISDEDRPSISADVERELKGTYYHTQGAILVVGGLGNAPDVAVDPSADKAYVVTEAGKLYAVDLTTHTKRQLMTSGNGGDGSLGTCSGVALDGSGHAYVTDRTGNRLLRVHLSSGHTEKVATVAQASGIRLDQTGAKAYVTTYDGKLYEADLRQRDEQPKLLVEGLGGSTSAVALDGKGKAYTGNRDGIASLREVDLTATPRTVRSVAASSTRRSGGLVLDGAGGAYVGDHWVDLLYRVDLAGGKEREAVKAVGQFSPLGVTLDSVNGVVYVSTYEGQLWGFSLRVLQSSELIEITTGV